MTLVTLVVVPEMPGAKRKVDEDTWIVTQSKKFKCGQLIANVYGTVPLSFILPPLKLNGGWGVLSLGPV